jgi:hypothetical protein
MRDLVIKGDTSGKLWEELGLSLTASITSLVFEKNVAHCFVKHIMHRPETFDRDYPFHDDYDPIPSYLTYLELHLSRPEYILSTVMLSNACSSLNSLVIYANGYTEIERYYFEQMTGLTSLKLIGVAKFDIPHHLARTLVNLTLEEQIWTMLDLSAFSLLTSIAFTISRDEAMFIPPPHLREMSIEGFTLSVIIIPYAYAFKDLIWLHLEQNICEHVLELFDSISEHCVNLETLEFLV